MPHHLRNVVVLIASCGALGMSLAAAQDRAAGPAQAEVQDRPGIVDGKPVAEVRGVWRSRGYGYLAQLDAGGVKLFHIAGGFCYADPGASDDVDGMFSFYRPFAPDALAFSTDVGGTRVVFDRV